jgi:glucose-1-phosphate adenylyltransferase
VLVLTQYKSHSLQKHLRDGWSLFNPELGEYITAVPPQMRRGGGWYDGTADAVYQNLYMLRRSGAERVLILPGDHIYRMDYAPMIAFHNQHDAAVTVACLERPYARVGLSGVLELGQNDRVNAYATVSEQQQDDDIEEGTALISMGIYLFSIEG